jgi:hypothetical protein
MNSMTEKQATLDKEPRKFKTKYDYTTSWKADSVLLMDRINSKKMIEVKLNSTKIK